MSTNAVFRLISSYVHCHLCYGREYKHDYKSYDGKLSIDYSKYKCCCEVPDKPHKDKKAYIYAIERHCFICMSQYSYMYVRYKEDSRHCLQEETHCDSYYLYLDTLKHAILTEAVKISSDYAYDLLIHSIQFLHYRINDLHVYFPKPLSMDQIRMLLNYYWLPTYKFLQPYKHPKHIKTIIELKSILLVCDWTHMYYKNTIDKAIRTISRVIRDYNTVKTNLYILCKNDKLCNDTASVVEAFLMKYSLSPDHNMDHRSYFSRSKDCPLKHLIGIYD